MSISSRSIMTSPAARAAIILLPCAILASGCAAPAAPPPVRTADGPCRSWADFPIDHGSNVAAPDLGCVSAINLRAMVVNPADLDHGRRLGPADGERATAAVEAYDQGKVKGGDSASAGGTAGASTGSSTSGSSGSP